MDYMSLPNEWNMECGAIKIKEGLEQIISKRTRMKPNLVLCHRDKKTGTDLLNIFIVIKKVTVESFPSGNLHNPLR